MKLISHMEKNRLQNSRVFFVKISKEIGKARSLALCFQPRSRPFV